MDDGVPAIAAERAAVLAVLGIETQVHYLTQTSLSNTSITREITDHAVRALTL
ncbi:hypothetical protein [Gordonia liuliyuniae]|uniref:TetR family transcriptional regulator n=1 Tax=Gordonia liuliyuniae TaxID=2911517 RepID=A0ABS9IWC6_9ACTN|nr:hypothetical protein [Gordonia liuliyuniae]MCF8589865.1 hypothetical protein [Gordonia liuliyuniae]